MLKTKQNNEISARFLFCFAIVILVVKPSVGFSMSAKCENGVLIINTTNPTDFEERLKSCPLASSVHLTLSSRSQYNFDALHEMHNLTVLTIDFFDSSPYQNSISLNTGNLPHFLDFQFLRRLPNLEVLAIEWKGAVINQELLNKLDHLMYAKLPLSAFHPSLFDSKSSVVQYDFGEDVSFTFRLDGKPDQLNYNKDDFEEFLNSARLRKFKKTASRMNNNRSRFKWNLDPTLERNDFSFVVDSSQTEINWRFSYPSGVLKIEGSFSLDTRMIHLYYQTNSSKSRTAIIGDSSEISLVYERNDWYEDPNYSELLKVGFKNGMKHGEFSEMRNGKIHYRQGYENGELAYDYQYTDSLPNLEFRYPLTNDINHAYIPYKEFFYKDNEYTLIKGYSGQMNDSATVQLLEIPFKEGKMDGTLVLRNRHGDTITTANFVNGVLDGEYYHFSISHGDTIVKRDYYKEGVLHGTRTSNSLKYESRAHYENGVLLHSVVNYRETGGKFQERTLYQEKGYSETKFWKWNGELQKVQRHDLKGKLISEKVYSLPEVDITLPSP